MVNDVMSQQMAILNNRRDVIANSKTTSEVRPFGRSAICHFGNCTHVCMYVLDNNNKKKH